MDRLVFRKLRDSLAAPTGEVRDDFGRALQLQTGFDENPPPPRLAALEGVEIAGQRRLDIRVARPWARERERRWRCSS